VNGELYLTNTDTISKVDRAGHLIDIVTGLPGLGDHQVNYPVTGADGKLYFAVGSATNTGVVGADNLAYEWLGKFPQVHDIPAHDIELVGRNYEDRDVVDDVKRTVNTGAFVAFREETRPGQVIKGNVKSNGSVLRCNADGSGLEVVAWGLRNPYGLAFDPNGRLFATEHGIDERGRRFIVGDADDFYEVREGAWYGWPDFASGIRLDDPGFGTGGKGREPVLAKHPDPKPPEPLLRFQPHAGANGVDFSRDERFGFLGDAFVALFGDLAPVTTPRLARPAGFKVVRIDMRSRQIVDFAVNKIEGPASKLPQDGFERPSHCAFGPDGHLYVVDWGEINIAPEKGGVRMKRQTGTLWRIRRQQAAAGDRPPQPRSVPLYLLQFVVLPSAAIAGAIALLRRLTRRRR
jgi:glucose/arabinose dehydrogenase